MTRSQATSRPSPRHLDAVTRFATVNGMDDYLDILQTHLIAIAQRPMTTDQLDRYAALLQGAETDALERLRRPRSVR